MVSPSSQLGPERWLRQVLDEQGGKHLPYRVEAKYTVRQHLLDLVSVSTADLLRSWKRNQTCCIVPGMLMVNFNV